MKKDDDDLDDDALRAIAALAKVEGKSPKELLAEMLRERAGTKLTKRKPRDDDEEESPEEAEARWREEEAALPDGVYSAGGMTGGGIFGSGPVATTDYDPTAHHRGESRMGNAAQIQMTRVLSKLMERIERLESRELPDRARPRELSDRRR